MTELEQRAAKIQADHDEWWDEYEGKLLVMSIADAAWRAIAQQAIDDAFKAGWDAGIEEGAWQFK